VLKVIVLLLLLALLSFLVTVIVEHLRPDVICTWYWHPISCETYSSFGIYAMPALPTLVAFFLMILALLVGLTALARGQS
jgi:hypothetical protein